MSLQIGFPYSTKCEKEKSNRHVYIIIPLLIIQCSIFSKLLSTKTKLFSALLTFSDLWIYQSVCVQACIHAKSFQSCPSLCSPSGSSVHGILQGRILEWIAMPSSRWFSQPRVQSRVSYASCIGRWWFLVFFFFFFLVSLFYHYHHLGRPDILIRSNQSLIHGDSLRPHESQHARTPCSTPTPGVHWDSRPSSQWCHPAISSSVVPFSSCPQCLPASESFPMS